MMHVFLGDHLEDVVVLRGGGDMLGIGEVRSFLCAR